MPRKVKCSWPGCKKAGDGGEEPLCAEHLAEVEYMNEEEEAARFGQAEELLDQFMDHAKVRAILDKGAGVLDSVRDLVEKVKSGNIMPNMPGRPTPPPRQAPPPPTKKNLELQARNILHFGAGEPLTVEKVKDRRKQLALMAHPDRGGSTEAFQKISSAADYLIAMLK